MLIGACNPMLCPAHLWQGMALLNERMYIDFDIISLCFTLLASTNAATPSSMLWFLVFVCVGGGLVFWGILLIDTWC